MKPKRVSLVISLLVFMSPVAHGGSISGRVTDSGGTGLSTVFVDLYDASGVWFDYTATDSTGNYRFSNLGSGGFYVHTDTLGVYAEEWFNNVPGASDDYFYDPLAAGATRIDVGYSASVTGIDLALERAGAIRGLVTDSSGAPVTNAYVDAYVPGGGRFLSDVTDSSGAYALAGLPAGSYAIRTDTLGVFVDEWHDQRVAFDSVTAAEAGVTSITVTAGVTLTNVNFQLEAGSEIRGTLWNGDGTSVPGAYVDLYSPSGVPLEFDRSDSNGVYQLRGLPAGTYYLGTDTLGSYVDLWYRQKVMATAGQPATDGADLVTVPALQVVSNCDFTLDAGGALSGYVVTTGGLPVVDAFVDVHLGAMFFDFALTGSNGAFRVAGLPDGVYYLKVDTMGRYLDEWHLNVVVMNPDDPAGDGATPVPVLNGSSVTGLVFELRPGAELAGRIADAGGQGIAGVYADLYNGEGRRLFYTKSDTNGMYRLGGLPAATYYLRTDAGGRYADEWYDDVPVIAMTNPAADGARSLVLAEGESRTGVNLDLRVGGSLSGTVLGTNAVPQSGTVVRVFYGSRPFVRGTTDSNGLYRVGALPPGTYYLCTDNAGWLLDEWYRDVYIFHDGLPLEDGATPVVLAADENRGGIGFVLGYGGAISGTIRQTGGAAAGQVVVDLFDAAGLFYDTIVSLGDGSYRFERLPPGSWYLGTDSLGLYLDEWFDDTLRDHFLDPAVDGAAPVTVVDGLVSTADFLLSLAPPEPVLLGLAASDPAGLIIEWMAVSNLAYQVERNVDLRQGAWTNAPSGATELESSYKPPAASGLRQYRDPAPPGRAAYRVKSL